MVIMVDYTLEYFHYSYHNIIVDDENNNNFKKFKWFLIKTIIIHFINVETDLRLWYLK
jgi:septin family protein